MGVKVVLATRNPDKAEEILRMFDGLDLEILTLEDFPDVPATVEDGGTLEANALKKAREARDATGVSALADDTGLEVDALDGAPGVRAARFAGDGATYQDNYRKLLDELRGVPEGQRDARFRTVFALALSPADAARLAAHHARHEGTARRPAVECLLSEGILPGHIATAPRGASGFGYDPVFVDGESGKTLAEMTPDEKNGKSHRYLAAIEMREMLLRHEFAREV